MKKKIIFSLIFLIIIVSIIVILFTNNISNNLSTVVSYKKFLPDEIVALNEDFYPAEITRDYILDRFSRAENKTGSFESDEWSGNIFVTGDLNIGNLTIAAGTFVFIDSNGDDQNMGYANTVDPVNPHEFLGADYSKTHVSINVDKLIAQGSPEKPIIITSNAESPWLADWEYLVFNRGILEYAVIEYGIGMAIGSSNIMIDHCVVRNMMSQMVMFGSWPEAGIYGESIAPIIVYNYVYNVGHMAVQSFFSNPYIAQNIFIQRHTNDPNLYEFLSKGENGALDIHGGNGTVEYNFLSCGYNSDVEKNRPEHSTAGVIITTASSPEILYNIIIGNDEGIGLQGGDPIINFNNIFENVDNNLVIRDTYSEPGKTDQTLNYNKPINIINNWWGSSEKDSILSNIQRNQSIDISYSPFASGLIQTSGPDWSEFQWLHQ